MKASDYFTLPESLAPFAAFFRAEVEPWEWLKQIEPALASWHFDPGSPRRFAPGLPADIPAGVHIEGPVYFHPTVKFPSYATICGPVWIGPDSVIRPGAVIRSHVITGAHCVLGTSCEYKHSLLLDHVETAHFNYVGDSVLGNRAHLGAGAICSNLRLDRQPVVIRGPEANYETGLRKFGAIVGDGAEVGCNAVLNPGTLLGRRSLVMPAVAFGGLLPEATIAKMRAGVVQIPRRD
jgi:NDP-sugar pyrophosphorylase family protein